MEAEDDLFDFPTDPLPRRPKPRVRKGMLCAKCGRDSLEPLPHFSVGSGTVFRSTSDDVLCLWCGNIAPPIMPLSQI